MHIYGCIDKEIGPVCLNTGRRLILVKAAAVLTSKRQYHSHLSTTSLCSACAAFDKQKKTAD